MGLPAASLHDRGTANYERHRTETTARYELVRDNLDVTSVRANLPVSATRRRPR